jgi:hypothetical protein
MGTNAEHHRADAKRAREWRAVSSTLVEAIATAYGRCAPLWTQAALSRCASHTAAQACRPPDGRPTLVSYPCHHRARKAPPTTAIASHCTPERSSQTHLAVVATDDDGVAPRERVRHAPVRTRDQTNVPCAHPNYDDASVASSLLVACAGAHSMVVLWRPRMATIGARWPSGVRAVHATHAASEPTGARGAANRVRIECVNSPTLGARAARGVLLNQNSRVLRDLRVDDPRAGLVEKEAVD